MTKTKTGTDLEQALGAAVASACADDVRQDEVRVKVTGVPDAFQEGTFHVELRRTDEAEAAESALRQRKERDEPRPVRDEPVTAEELDEEADAAADFLEGFLDAMDMPGDLKIKVHEDHAEVEITEMGSGSLIGRRGQTLDALQELVRASLQRQFQRRSHVQIDAEGYRARRLEKLLEKVDDAIDAVLDSGESVRLEPMDVYERKAVHHRVAEVDGVLSRSLGREPGRRVVIEADGN